MQFPAQACAACPLQIQCTTSARGRSVQIHLGPRKNLFDLRRVAVVHNLHVIARQPTQAQQAA